MTSAAACAAQIKHSVALSLGAIGAEQAIIMILTPAGIPLIWAATEAHSPQLVPLLSSGLTLVGLLACLSKIVILSRLVAVRLANPRSMTISALPRLEDFEKKPLTSNTSGVGTPQIDDDDALIAADYRRRQRRSVGTIPVAVDRGGSGDAKTPLLEGDTLATAQQAAKAAAVVEHITWKASSVRGRYQDGDTTDVRQRKDFTAQVLALRGMRSSNVLQRF